MPATKPGTHCTFNSMMLYIAESDLCILPLPVAPYVYVPSLHRSFKEFKEAAAIARRDQSASVCSGSLNTYKA